jgi:hypothetical protein
MHFARVHLRLPQLACRLVHASPGVPEPWGACFASHNLELTISGAVLAVEPENFLNRVLLVADNPVAGAIIREQLSAAGYDVHWARNRVEGGVLWQPSYYDVVLLDLRRDPREGEDFARRVKATDPGQRIIFLDGRDGTKEAA